MQIENKNGIIVISDIISNEFIKKTYIFYTQEEAVADFLTNIDLKNTL